MKLNKNHIKLRTKILSHSKKLRKKRSRIIKNDECVNQPSLSISKPMMAGYQIFAEKEKESLKNSSNSKRNKVLTDMQICAKIAKKWKLLSNEQKLAYDESHV